MNYNILKKKINNQKAKIGIIGLGYVGLDLILLLSKKNTVFGFDKNNKNKSAKKINHN